GDMFVVYDAPENEISALARDGQGNLYAGTAQAEEEAGGGAAEENNNTTEQSGRPEAEPHGVPIPSKPPPTPAPPPIPSPAPGEPLPIPKQTRALIPSPLYSGERVRVRGGLPEALGIRPLTPALSPDYGGEGD